MNNITKAEAERVLEYEPPRYLFRRFNLLNSIRPASTFLEVGAGNMLFTRELAVQFEHGVVVEYGGQTEHIYKHLRQTHFPNVDLIALPFEQANLQEQFDLVIACEVLEHVEDDSAFFDALLECVQPGGQLVLSVPAHMRYWSIHDEIVGHYRRYSRMDLEKLLRDNGLTHFKIIAYGYPFTDFFRILRVRRAKREMAQKQNLPMTEQTELSGITQIPQYHVWSQHIINRKTIWPFAAISTLFNGLDLANGYIVVAQKP